MACEIGLPSLTIVGTGLTLALRGQGDYLILVVFSNGRVGACACRDLNADSQLVLGQVGESSIRAMWVGDKMRKLVGDWRRRNRVPDICRRCSLYTYVAILLRPWL